MGGLIERGESLLQNLTAKGGVGLIRERGVIELLRYMLEHKTRVLTIKLASHQIECKQG